MSIAAIKLDCAAVAAEIDYPKPERLLRGNPQRTTWNQYSNSSAEVYAGIWSSQPGAWRIQMGEREDELFTVINGRCRVSNTQGHACECGPGESLVIPAGFIGVFEVLETLTKHYMIVDRGAQHA